MLSLDDVERGFALARPQDVDLAPLEHEAETDGLDDVRLVIDDKDLHPASSGGPADRDHKRERAPVAGPAANFDRPPCACAMASALGRPSPTPS